VSVVYSFFRFSHGLSRLLFSPVFSGISPFSSMLILSFV